MSASVENYLASYGLSGPRCASLGVATAVTGDQVVFTNSNWSFSIAALKDALALERCLVINDFMALALSLPVLCGADVRQIGAGQSASDAPLALIGPGTGLGVSGLMPDGHGEHSAISGEGGHVTLAPTDELESSVVAHLQRHFGHASAERALSGPGLVNVYAALCAIEGAPVAPLAPPDITSRAIAGSDRLCQMAVRVFSSFLGNVAGNLALTLGARGGLYIGGGIVPQMGSAFDAQLFRQKFEDKGRFAHYLQEIPSWLIVANAPALVGASRALDVYKSDPR